MTQLTLKRSVKSLNTRIDTPETSRGIHLNRSLKLKISSRFSKTTIKPQDILGFYTILDHQNIFLREGDVCLDNICGGLTPIYRMNGSRHAIGPLPDV